MCRVVTLDVRRLITVMRTAMIPTPSAIVNQSAIVCSLSRSRPPTLPRTRWPGPFVKALQQVDSESSCPGNGQGLGRSPKLARRRNFSVVAENLRESPSRRPFWKTTGDCAAARSSSIGEQSTAGRADEIAAFGVGYVSTVSRPYLRSRPYSCVRVSPSRFAALDLLPRVSRITCRMV
jgi:hypothetical protein